MRLSTLFVLYILATALASISTIIGVQIKGARIKRIPVNSGPSLEAAPRFYPGHPEIDNRPACIAPSGTSYYGGLYSANSFEDVSSYDFESCAVGPDGSVYVLSKRDKQYWVRAYSASGPFKWAVSVGEMTSTPAVAESGAVYLIAGSFNSTKSLICIGPTGSELWRIPLGTGNSSLLAPVIGPTGTIYAVQVTPVPSMTSELVAISIGGRELWRASLPEFVQDVIVSQDDRVFLHVPHGIATFNARGEQLWKFSSDPGERNYQLGDGGVALAPDGTIYLASRFLYAIGSTGKVKWTFKSELTFTKGDFFATAPLVANDGTVYVASQQLYAITSDGHKKWVLGGQYVSLFHLTDQPMLTPDGKLITPAGWFQVTSGLAKTGWPAKDRDVTNSRRQETP